MNEYENNFFMKCQENGEFDSFQDYIKKCNDFSLPHIVYIKQSDFSQNPISSEYGLKGNHAGTLRLVNSNYYILSEDIEIDFFNNIDDERPTKNQLNQPIKIKNYNQSSIYPKNDSFCKYKYGFFAGITVECSDVVIEMNNNHIFMSRKNYLLQPNFSLIQISPMIYLPPIIENDISYKKISNIIVRNGSFGLTSGVSIGGVNNTNVIIKNCQFIDFDKSAINLYNSSDVSVNNSYIIRNNYDKSTNVYFEALLYMKNSLDSLMRLKQEKKEGTNNIQKIQKKIKNYINKYIDSNTNGKRDESFSVSNVNFISDIPCCGIYFGYDSKISSQKNKNIIIYNIKIEGLIINPKIYQGYTDGEIMLVNNGYYFSSSLKKTMYLHFLREINKFKKQKKEIMRHLKIKNHNLSPDEDSEEIYFTNPTQYDIAGLKGICIKNGVNIFINDICIRNLKNIGGNEDINLINEEELSTMGIELDIISTANLKNISVTDLLSRNGEVSEIEKNNNSNIFG